jgi:DNA-binding NtrC family response regulator
VPLGIPIEKVEKEYILASLQRNGGNKARTAEVLGISEKTLYNKLNRYAAEARSRAGDPRGEAAGAKS